MFNLIEAYYRASAPADPQNGPKTPTQAKNRVLGLTVARGGVTGRTAPLFPCTLRVPDRFRRVRDPNGTVLTTFRLPAGPIRKFFQSGVPGVPKKISPIIFLFKNVIHWVLIGFWAPKKNSFWTPLDPPKGAILAHFTHKMAKMGFKNGQKTHF